MKFQESKMSNVKFHFSNNFSCTVLIVNKNFSKFILNIILMNGVFI